ncbi:hypothetical protein DERP_011615 [Dermatophagoides pteronyssinus]|uniref:Uncharacterized protein n=1 Tax=Dermatophagoides pteronyssinus TaxID=6956 RepID=A0ABQ8JWF1_DERPT|nr:hypothetical protein DERP_011615 [Dermatophagoides pteronyssinus]
MIKNSDGVRNFRMFECFDVRIFERLNVRKEILPSFARKYCLPILLLFDDVDHDNNYQYFHHLTRSHHHNNHLLNCQFHNYHHIHLQLYYI